MRSNFDQALLISFIIISTLHQAVCFFVIALFSFNFKLLILDNLLLLCIDGVYKPYLFNRRVYFSFIFFFFRCHHYYLSSIMHWFRLVYILLFFKIQPLFSLLHCLSLIHFCWLYLFLVIIERKTIIYIVWIMTAVFTLTCTSRPALNDTLIKWIIVRVIFTVGARWPSALLILTRLLVFVLLLIFHHYLILWSLMLFFDDQNLFLHTLDFLF